MHFLDIEPSVANEFPAHGEHRNLVPVAHARLGRCIDIDHIDADTLRRGEHAQRDQHVLAQPAARSRIQHESRGRLSPGRVSPGRVSRRPFSAAAIH